MVQTRIVQNLNSRDFSSLSGKNGPGLKCEPTLCNVLHRKSSAPRQEHNVSIRYNLSLYRHVPKASYAYDSSKCEYNIGHFIALLTPANRFPGTRLFEI